MSEVRWAPVVDFEGFYEVSTEGEVRTVARVITWADGTHGRFQPAKVRKQCVPKRQGRVTYARVSLNRGGRQNHISAAVHILVLEAFVGPRPAGMEGRHMDGNSLNNCSSNLAWGTPAQNSQDRDAHGTTARGERVATAVLCADEVRAIRASCDDGPSLGGRYGVSKQTVYDIKSGRHWRHLLVTSASRGA